MRELIKFIQNVAPAARKRVQLDYLDRFFNTYVREQLQSWFQRENEALFEGLAKLKTAEKPDEERLAYIFEQVAGSMNDKDEPAPVVARFQLPINTRFFGDVSPRDICALDAWRRVHQNARAHDYAVVLEGFTQDETGFENGGWKRAHVSFNLLDTYRQGQLENGDFYPVMEDPPSFMDAVQNDNATDPRPSRPATHWAPGPGRGRVTRT